MRVLVAAALLAASPAMAEDPFLTGDALAAEVASHCAEGCVVLSRAQADALMANVNQVLQRREAEAHRAGKLSCRNAGVADRQAAAGLGGGPEVRQQPQGGSRPSGVNATTIDAT
jgi:hypothetical protein